MSRPATECRTSEDTLMRLAMPAFVIGLLLLAGSAASAQARTAAPVTATPQNAASFVGDWAIAAGDASMTLKLTVVDGKLVGEASSQVGTNPVQMLSVDGPSLVAGYSFDYQGMSIDAVVTLTPNDKTKT